MRFAEVCVNSPISGRQTYSYSIPEGMHIVPGQAVFVPFGAKRLQGIVLALTDTPAVEETRDISGVIEQRPLLFPSHLALAYWLSSYYLSSLFDAVSLMLPPGFERDAIPFISESIPADFDIATLNEEQKALLGYIVENGRTAQSVIEKTFGQKKARQLVAAFIKRGLLARDYELEPIRMKPKTENVVCLSVSSEEAMKLALELKRSKLRVALLEYLAESKEAEIPLSLVYKKTGCTRQTVNSLMANGWVTVREKEVRRDPLSARAVNLSFPLPLTPAQEAAYKAISRSLVQPAETAIKPFLLYGVTGSGKTEIYLQSLAEAVRLGKRGIVLVPEISLTPQTIERFASRFPGRVAVLHSQLSLGEQYDEWQKIRNGDADVVIGPRSALFAPMPELGLIILDEEHEWTYKQVDVSPRYHTRDAALKLAELTGAVVILGSATPSVESYYKAQVGEYDLRELRERVTPRYNTPLPPVDVVDMREELKAGNRSMFSRVLTDAIHKALSGGEQVMLFLNRRGGATFVQCRDCGFVLLCRRCDSPLSYHPAEDRLICHHCNYRTATPLACPQCHSRRIKYLGTGTQKLEVETSETFPGARLLRWDSDTTKNKKSHQEIMDIFRSHAADILIGTQMIAKGIDVPGVTVVGVVNADISLHLPDFRSGERTFQLLSQVAGRAGRGPLGGRVVLQTYTPDNYAIKAAAGQSYPQFYADEIEYRRKLNYPPFSRLAGLTFTHTNETVCQQEAERMKERLNNELLAQGIAGISIIGPAPAFVPRLRGKFRWKMILRGQDLSLLASLDIPQGWTLDIDPVGL